MTSSVRGNLALDVNVKCLTKGVHSGIYSGIAPDSMRIIRSLLSRIEKVDEKGVVTLDEFNVDIDKIYIERAKVIAPIFEQNCLKKIKGS